VGVKFHTEKSGVVVITISENLQIEGVTCIMGKKIITVPNAPKYPFSPAVRAGDYIFVSGQGGFLDAKGREVKGIEGQTRQCLENVKEVLRAADSSLNDVIKVTIFLRDVDHYEKMNEMYQSYLPEDYPARSTIVTSLVMPKMLVEMECIAYSPLKPL
jgi:2-iminobutanoate/2-iminopropanoate deaminase